jgi:hypothetical protein
LLVALSLCSIALSADDRIILFDDQINFAAFKTFTLLDGGIDSERPELASPIATKKLADAVRATLVARGLQQTADRGDLLVEHRIATVDYGFGSFGRANPIGPGRARGGVSSLTVDFTEGTLVVDLKAGDAGALVWRGVYRDTQSTGAKLAETLTKGAVRLLSAYPPQIKK